MGGIAHLVIVSSNDVASASNDMPNSIYVKDNILDETTHRLLGGTIGGVIIIRMVNRGFFL